MQRFRSVGECLQILQVNVEGLSAAKSIYLSKLAEDFQVDVILLEETHVSTDEAFANRGQISGFGLIASLNDSVYGLATFIRSDITDYKFISMSKDNNIHQITISVGGLTIVNVYKPPNAMWPYPPLETHPHSCIYLGDFNSHHSAWGYNTIDVNGEALYDWSLAENIHLVFDAKTPATFHSARWNTGSNPDLCFVSTNRFGNPLETRRQVLNKFPNSQHRPVMIKIGIQIPMINSIPKARWNFHKANWFGFSKALDSAVRWIPPVHKNYDRFVNLVKSCAKKYIPRGFRKEYIPGWSSESTSLYNEYNTSQDPVIAAELLRSLDENRLEKWKETVDQMCYTHSSRKSWNTLRKLGSGDIPSRVGVDMNPNRIAARLVNMSKISVDKTIRKCVKRELRTKKSMCPISTDFSRDFAVDEINLALMMIKPGKSPGFDDMFNEFLIHTGPRTRLWLSKFYSNILASGNIPPLFKKAKVIAIVKPGKAGNSPEDFRPISLLSVCFKFMEKLLLNRISDSINEVIPIEQAGFRSGRNCCDQVLSLVTHIETGFQLKLKTGTAYVDLSAAYDTVWRDGLVLKFLKIIPDQTLARLLNNMLSNRFIQVHVGFKSSRFRRLNDGLFQGSVLAPLLFSLYLHDIPATKSRKFIYADDICLASQHQNFRDIESELTEDLHVLEMYFKSWRLKPNPLKTEVNAYHLSNSLANFELNVQFSGLPIKHNQHPKYLGVTLDRSLTFKKHLENVAAKLKSRVNIIQKLAGSTWGANPSVLRTSSLALVYSVAEYCCPVWLNSSHVNKVDVELNKTMRIISGNVSSTEIQWLPVLSNIAPAHLRRLKCCFREWSKIILNPALPCHLEILQLPPRRLPSRRPSYEVAVDCLSGKEFDLVHEWNSSWASSEVYNKLLVTDPTLKVAGFDLPRHLWKAINRIRTGQGRCGSCLHKWGFIESPACDCGAPDQSMEHIVEFCPLRLFSGGIMELNILSDNAIIWLTNLDLAL